MLAKADCVSARTSSTNVAELCLFISRKRLVGISRVSTWCKYFIRLWCTKYRYNLCSIII